MSRYRDLIRARGGDKEDVNILNVNINNIHSNTRTGVDKPTPGGDKHTLKGSAYQKLLQGEKEGDRERTTLRHTTDTTYSPESEGVTTYSARSGTSIEDLYEEKRALFLKAVRYLHERGGYEAVDRLTDGDPAELDRVWLDETTETFREYLRRRVRAALAERAA